MKSKPLLPLPVSWEECEKRNWDAVDIVLVSGDAYIDHPSFGIALIGRLLESQGYRVAMLAQPEYQDATDFRRFGKPRLFFGISAGNLDSIVANYSSNGKVRDRDAYSPHGSPWRSGEKSRKNRYRPDRAALIYSNLARQAYPDATLVLGGIESSLRRFVHFDYQQNLLRGSQLSDAKADLLIYGMAETAISRVAAAFAEEKSVSGFAGTCIRMTDSQFQTFTEQLPAEQKLTILPSFTEITDNPELFLKAELAIDRHARQYSSKILAQKQQAVWVVQFPPSAPLDTKAFDALYQLGFSRKAHPANQQIPAEKMIRDSVTVVRGCPGNCSFCAISRHQGPATVSRSVTSVLTELQSIADQPEFSGTISDLGGPTANLFGTECSIGSCASHDCLFPTVCKNLLTDEKKSLELLDKALQINGIKQVFISSGLRMELLRKTPELFRKIVLHHTPGAMKIAPEHTEDHLLQIMHKEPHQDLLDFTRDFKKICKQGGSHRQITPYIISAHPGCTEADTKAMVKKLQRAGLSVRQFQDFTPSPGTISTAMYVSERDRRNNKPLYVAKKQAERNRQRKIIEDTFLTRKKNKKQNLGSPRSRHRS
ncbi:MAG: YgiQ family radical SAM protein [Desulfobulbaceae bacterium]|nr:MAG: YgiQ family radical SAM protein [Desulfobulbaceae bacterium]